MDFKENVIKEYLKNVYFVTGTPCGGKTTISRELAKRYNLLVYDVDEQFANHKKSSDAVFQPAMNKVFKSADEFFFRPVEEYRQWLTDTTREQLEFVLLDLMRLSKDQPVICDCHLTIEQAKMFTDKSRIVFLLKEPSDIIDDYCNRKDHQDFKEFIYSTSDVEKAKAICNETLRSKNEMHYSEVKASEFFWLERTADCTVEERVNKVAQHFGFAD